MDETSIIAETEVFRITTFFYESIAIVQISCHIASVKSFSFGKEYLDLEVNTRNDIVYIMAPREDVISSAVSFSSLLEFIQAN